MGAKARIPSNATLKNKEIKFLELKLKKELNDKHISSHKKFTMAILAGREFIILKHPEVAHDFYQIANEMRIEENKQEAAAFLANKKLVAPTSPFLYEVNLKSLLKKKSFEKAILSLNPEYLKNSLDPHYQIVYDLLNVIIKKRSVKRLYCSDEFQKDPDAYQYSNLLCGLLIDYLHDGKLGSAHIKIVEEYFLKHDLKEIYLLQVAKELKTF